MLLPLPPLPPLPPLKFMQYLAQNFVYDSKGQLQDPNLTDDTIVIEAPSFIVPYVYEKPPREAFADFKADIKKMMADIKAKLEKEEKDKAEKDKEKDADKDKTKDKDAEDAEDRRIPKINPLLNLQMKLMNLRKRRGVKRKRI